MAEKCQYEFNIANDPDFELSAEDESSVIKMHVSWARLTEHSLPMQQRLNVEGPQPLEENTRAMCLLCFLLHDVKINKPDTSAIVHMSLIVRRYEYTGPMLARLDEVIRESAAQQDAGENDMKLFLLLTAAYISNREQEFERVSKALACNATTRFQAIVADKDFRALRKGVEAADMNLDELGLTLALSMERAREALRSEIHNGIVRSANKLVLESDASIQNCPCSFKAVQYQHFVSMVTGGLEGREQDDEEDDEEANNTAANGTANGAAEAEISCVLTQGQPVAMTLAKLQQMAGFDSFVKSTKCPLLLDGVQAEHKTLAFPVAAETAVNQVVAATRGVCLKCVKGAGNDSLRGCLHRGRGSPGAE